MLNVRMLIKFRSYQETLRRPDRCHGYLPKAAFAKLGHRSGLWMREPEQSNSDEQPPWNWRLYMWPCTCLCPQHRQKSRSTLVEYPTETKKNKQIKTKRKVTKGSQVSRGLRIICSGALEDEKSKIEKSQTLTSGWHWAKEFLKNPLFYLGHIKIYETLPIFSYEICQNKIKTF